MTESSPAGAPTCYRHPGREAHIRCQRCERPICPDCMIPASVGFQCPECVKEGQRSQRPLRTTYGGLRPSAPGFVTTVLIGVNVAVWLLVTLTGGDSGQLLRHLWLLSQDLCGGLAGVPHQVCTSAGGNYYPGVSDGAYWQLLTSAFTHVQILHLGLNMLALWVLGPQLEQMFGHARFLAIYLVSALAGSALVYATTAVQPTLGASGAIFGLMGALLVVALRTRINVSGVLVLVGINAVFTLSVPNVSWQAHLGGFIGGALVAAAIVWAPRAHRAVVQWGGTAAVTGLVAALVVARTLALV